MNLRTLQKADWFIGLTLAVFLAPVARILGTLFRRDHSFDSKDTIVVMKLLGGGNFALAMPMLLGLRKSFPKSHLVAVTTRSTVEFAKAIKVFDSVRLIDTRSLGSLIGSAFRTLVSIFRVDVVIDLEAHSKLSTCFGLFSCARNRIGFFTNDFFLREYLYTHLVFFNLRASRAILFERLAEIVGARCASYKECEDHLRSALSVGVQVDRSIAVGVGCSDLGRVRQLNAKQWIEVLEKELPSSDATKLLFLGAASDYQLSEDIVKELRQRYPNLHLDNLCGSCSLSESLRILGSCGYFYTIDSGLLHFARLMRVPCMSFWGPTDPATRIVPIAGYEEVIRYRPLICSPCIHVAETPPCRGRNLCISSLFDNISVSESEALANITISPTDKITSQLR
jgi:ADP-heptose:LPS heptosyltransferase